VLVDDQDRALRFYTEVLGFTKMADIPMGEYRFLTVASKDHPEDAQLFLEAIRFPPSAVYQKALYDASMPATSVISTDLEKDRAELTAKGVRFRGEPRNAGVILTVLFEDTCGNLVNLVQPLQMPG
ncbi:MAG TPA: VOC family protein, partial [Rectinemataceae bacterium]|nr:VOC family protein [Rectinemataceae bacterium]